MNPLITAGITAGVTYFFTKRQWQYENMFNWKKDALQSSETLFKDLSSALDPMIFAMDQAAWALLEGQEEEIPTKWTQYQDSLKAWYQNKNTTIATLKATFGEAAFKSLKHVFKQLKWLHDDLLHHYNAFKEKTPVEDYDWDHWKRGMARANNDIRKLYSGIVEIIGCQRKGIFDDLKPHLFSTSTATAGPRSTGDDGDPLGVWAMG